MNVDTGVYVIVNRITGNLYIGQSIAIKKRWRKHLSTLRAGKHHCSKLQHAWGKYGEDAFEFKVLDFVPVDELDVVEQRYIDKYEKEYLYNVSLDVKSPMRGFRHSPESIEKIRAYTKMNAPMRGKKHTPEALAKIGAASRGENNWSFGRPVSPDQRAKISAANTGRRLTSEQKALLSSLKIGDRHPCARAVRCKETNMIFSTGTYATRWLKENGYPKAVQAALYFACTGKRKMAYGYRWEFVDKTGAAND